MTFSCKKGAILGDQQLKLAIGGLFWLLEPTNDYLATTLCFIISQTHIFMTKPMKMGHRWVLKVKINHK